MKYLLFVMLAFAASPITLATDKTNDAEHVFLLPYFPGNGETGIYLTASDDGLKFDWLNDGKPILRAPESPYEASSRPHATRHRVESTEISDRKFPSAERQMNLLMVPLNCVEIIGSGMFPVPN